VARFRPPASLFPLLRLALLAVAVWALHLQHTRAAARGTQALTVSEVRTWLPTAGFLRPDTGPRQGWWVEDAQGGRIGYAACTAPLANSIRGYSGPTDTLMVFGPDERLLGLAIRHSYDTPSHVADVAGDVYYMEGWNGRTWAELAALDPANGGVHGVSGATRTSLALARSLVHRTRGPTESAPDPWTFGRADAVLLAALAGGLWFSFAPHGPHTRRARRLFQIAVFLGVGLLGGDLLAQSLFLGWAQYGVAWRATPGLALLALAALAIPALTRRPMYCSHICPHGAAQEWLGRWVPARFKWQPPPAIAWGLGLLPGTLLLAVMLTGLLGLSLDLAGLEPFDAYAFRSAGTATLVLFGVSLLASAFVPMAYCRFGCPTGALLRFVRSHGAADHFGRSDGFALAIALFAWMVVRHTEPLERWIVEAPWW
jgi:hypothetical protein